MTVTTMAEVLDRMEKGFWRRYNANPDLRRKLAGKDRIIHLHLKDADDHWFDISDGRLVGLHHGAPAGKAHVTITAKQADVFAVFNKELPPMQAILTGRVRVKASPFDILFAKSLLGG